MAKILKHFYIEPEQVRYLECESKRTGKSQAQIVRELIEQSRFDTAKDETFDKHKESFDDMR